MPVRVLVPEASRPDEQLTLSADESAHVARVLRLGPGAAVRVFNGRGAEWTATIVTSARAAVTVALHDAIAPARETRVRYSVAIAVLKGDGTDDAIRDAVMMGAARICPFVPARAEIPVAVALRGERLERWRRVAVSSAKQCGRAVVPEITPAVSFAALTAAPASGAGPRLLLVEPSLSLAALALADVAAPLAVTLAIGPEGGWTTEEVSVAEREGWLLVSLGGRTLRATSAPLAALAACQAVWRDD